MNTELTFEPVTPDRMEELAALYADTFRAEPWNEPWTEAAALKRLTQLMSAGESMGLCALCGGELCGAAVGSAREYLNGPAFEIVEFWVKNGMRGQGIGTRLMAELETRLKQAGVTSVFLLTSEGGPERFYRKQGLRRNENMILMNKPL